MLKLLKKINRISHQATIIRALRRILPTFIGLFVIGTFLQTNPKLATQFVDQLRERFGFSSSVSLKQTDFFKEINYYRQNNSKSPLSHTITLDSFAHIVALSTANTSDLTPQITLEQGAQIVGFSYKNLRSLSFISSPLAISNNWLIENQDDLLDPQFTQIGISSLKITHDQQEQLLTVIVLAQPTSSQTTNQPPKTPQDYYTGVELWTKVQKCW